MNAISLFPTKASGGARSPAELIPIADDVRLVHLDPAEQAEDLEPFPVPIVLVPSLLSQWYVFDLHPHRTLAGFLRDHGLDVWVVDWGRPYSQRPTPSFGTYVDEYLSPSVDLISSRGEASQVTILGYSLGGVLSTVFAASYPEQVRNLITLTTPIDFHMTGLTATWARYFPIDPFIDILGNVPSWWVKGGFRSLALMRGTHFLSHFAEDKKTPEGREVIKAVQEWVDDSIPIAGEMYRTLVKDCYKENLLVRGGLPMGGRTVQLSDITAALLTITAADDYLCPPRAAQALNRAVSTDDETSLTVPGSHLGAVVGHRANHLLWTRIVDWLDSRSGHHPQDWAPVEDIDGR